MGVLFDYFRAPSREAATVRPDIGRADLTPARGQPTFDAVGVKGIGPGIELAQLIGLIQEVPWTLDLVDLIPVYPSPEGAPTIADERSPYLDGPGIDELPVSVRDVLAGVDDARLPDLAGRWLESDSEYALTLIQDLVSLARRAKESDELLYCWMCA
ncbi:hypothetical protein [Nonomuraea endophytica]|uniref:hypothetical protein n=1 Tax=Nonomuraea endophytica TaxID=714136 RepID=UPI0037C933AE